MELHITYKLWDETRAEVSRFKRAVDNGNSCVEALHFGRYLIWSGIVSHCKRFNNRVWAGAPVDGALLEWEVNQLIEASLRVVSRLLEGGMR